MLKMFTNNLERTKRTNNPIKPSQKIRRDLWETLEIMRPINTFTLAKHAGEHEQWPLVSELIRSGISTGKYVPGYVLEAQYEHNGYYLLATSWDCPFEESQTFSLLSPSLDVIQKHTIGAAYATVWMEGHKPITENAIMFNCDGDLDVQVTVDLHPTPKLLIDQYDRATGKRWPPRINRWRIRELLKLIAVVLVLLGFGSVIWSLRNP